MTLSVESDSWTRGGFVAVSLGIRGVVEISRVSCGDLARESPSRNILPVAVCVLTAVEVRV